MLKEKDKKKHNELGKRNKCRKIFFRILEELCMIVVRLNVLTFFLILKNHWLQSLSEFFLKKNMEF